MSIGCWIRYIIPLLSTTKALILGLLASWAILVRKPRLLVLFLFLGVIDFFGVIDFLGASGYAISSLFKFGQPLLGLGPDVALDSDGSTTSKIQCVRYDLISTFESPTFI